MRFASFQSFTLVAGTAGAALYIVMGIAGALFALHVVAAEPDIPPGKGDTCVADTDFMRRNHMDLLTHQRDDTVLRGIRGKPFSLVDCVECHTQQDDQGKHVRIDSAGQFCASCHTYAAVKIDCFSCHAAVPDGDSPHAQGTSASTSASTPASTLASTPPSTPAQTSASTVKGSQ